MSQSMTNPEGKGNLGHDITDIQKNIFLNKKTFTLQFLKTLKKVTKKVNVRLPNFRS